MAEVSRPAAREKSIRHGHPSTLHPLVGTPPLASSLAVLMALLLPDPCDPSCPDEFKSRGKGPPIGDARSGPRNGTPRSRPAKDYGRSRSSSSPTSPTGTTRPKRRTWKPDWDRHGPPHPEETPLVVDPFASDLNPFACFIPQGDAGDYPLSSNEIVRQVRK